MLYINLKGTKSHATAKLNTFATLMIWLMVIFGLVMLSSQTGDTFEHVTCANAMKNVQYFQ